MAFVFWCAFAFIHYVCFSDDASQQDMFHENSDDEKQEEEIDNETKWRMERYEREKWLQEQKVKDQLLRFCVCIFIDCNINYKSIQHLSYSEQQ